MSKLDRLNARVEKLLTVAVYEVLEVVKETVSEYQEKTARTQRENESLKRRLQELQDEIKRENTVPLNVMLPEEEAHAGRQEPNLDLSLDIQKEDSEPSVADHQPIISNEHGQDLKQESNEREKASAVESQVECNLAQTAEHCKVQPEELTHIIEAAATAQTSYIVNSVSRAQLPQHADSPNNPSTSHSNTQLRLNLAVIKSEPELTDCNTLDVPAVHEPYSGCVDLSSNSSHHDSAEAQRPQLGSGPYGLVLVHSNHNATSRRHVFAKTNRTVFDARKNRREYFRGDGDEHEPHVCFVCGKTFSRGGNLRIHQRCHTGEKPYGCVQCGRCFSQAGDLKKHKRVHTGEKPYFCNLCGKSFSRGENLKRHQKIHIGENLQSQQAWTEHQ